MAEAGQSGACSVCGAFDAAFGKLLWLFFWVLTTSGESRRLS